MEKPNNSRQFFNFHHNLPCNVTLPFMIEFGEADRIP